MTINLQEIQREHMEWATYNFGPRNPTLCLIGVTEEIGELCEAQINIKYANRNGHDDNEYKVDAIDAIGDILIYFLDYCNGVNFNLQDIYNSALSYEACFGDDDSDPLEVLVLISRHLGKLCHAELKKVQSIRGYNNPEKFNREAGEAIYRVLIQLLEYCRLYSFDLEGALQATWDSVKVRDFQKFPLNGKTE